VVKKYDPDAPASEDIVSYSRDLPFYVLKEMQDRIKSAHNLYNRKIEWIDKMYLLHIINYSELQRTYRNHAS
tara:strand:+ start:153 stop:368 length:216 start_codon:yes stop_codon:yes gene_type:complete